MNDELGMMKGNNLYIDTSDAERIYVRLEKNGEEFSREALRDRKSQVTLELIEQLLQESGLKLDQIDNLYVKEGPGSYTGLKVGATIANTLSFVLQVPVNDLPLGKFAEPKY